MCIYIYIYIHIILYIYIYACDGLSSASTGEKMTTLEPSFEL